MDTPVVLITGALTGIGRAAARAFAREGHRTVVAGRHEETGQKLVTELRALGTEAEFFRTDVRHEDEVRNLVDRTVARFGRLDVAVNNAGTEGQPGPVTQQTADAYAATFDTNVLGTLFSMKHELRVMQAQGSGSIVNISSTYGHEGGAGASIYVASKHAVEGMTKSVRSRPRTSASASTPWLPVRQRPACLTASPEPRRGRLPWRRQSRWGASASRTRLLTPLCSLRPTRRLS
jgi:NAD(P)-dependent dehydrogenase (short-subunit alcohol dehydrogenase family)